MGRALILGAAATIALAGCQASAASSQPTSSTPCAEPSAAVTQLAQDAKDTPTSDPAYKFKAAAVLQVLVAHPECFSSALVAQAREALDNFNKPNVVVEAPSP